MILESGQLKSDFPTLVKEHNTVQFFKTRAQRLKRISSSHMFLIEKAQYSDFPTIVYESRTMPITLATLLTQQVELLPTEIKAIAWQVTKFMLHCQELAVSHLRLCPEAIVLADQYVPDRPFFLRVKDFSLGKEFESVSEGKVLPFFEYLHPDLSVGNQTPSYDTCLPRYDIWSLGIILYRLIYRRSPFCKEGKLIFSKTILRKYLAREYEVHFLSNKFASVNLFIGRCLDLEGGFRDWTQVREWMVGEEEIYNQLDFHDGQFEELAEMHLRLMALFSGIYCMIVDQCANSPHPFWRKPISATNRAPFQYKIAEFTLRLMKVYEDRFSRIYGAHIALMRRSQVREALGQVSRCLAAELEEVREWTQEKFSRPALTLEVIRVIQEVCVNVRLELSDLDMPGSQRRIGNAQRTNSFTTRKVWKSMQTLHDYCNEVIFIFNNCRNRMKRLYEEFYLSKVFEAILIEDFGYHEQFMKFSLSEFTRKIQPSPRSA